MYESMCHKYIEKLGMHCLKHDRLHIIAEGIPQPAAVAVVECMWVVSTAGAGGTGRLRRVRGWGSTQAATEEVDGVPGHMDVVVVVVVRMQRMAGKASREVAVVAGCTAAVAGTRGRPEGRSRQEQWAGRQERRQGQRRERRGCPRQVVSQGQSSPFCLHV